MKQTLLLIYLSCLCCFSGNLNASGLSVYPMEQNIFPGRPVFYEAKNTKDQAIAVEVFAESWDITEDGQEVRTVTDDLGVFPTQFILKGNTTKNILCLC